MIHNSVRFIRLKDVARLCGLPQSTIVSLSRKSDFPKSVRFSERSQAWVESEITAWLNNTAGRTILNGGHKATQQPSVTTPKAKPETLSEPKTESKQEATPMKDHPMRIIRVKEVEMLTGLSASGIYRLEFTHGFPKRVQIGNRAVGWRLGEVLSWLETR